jgi:phospholipid/cholesterol/gamma-HCH transport system ATP-binding protein
VRAARADDAAVPSAVPTPHLEMSGIAKAFDGVPALRGADLTVARGTTAVVLGPSGCGKSVLLKHVVGLLRPDAGSVRIDGRRIDDLPERSLDGVRRRIGVVFQGAALFDSMDVAANVGFPLEDAGVAGSERDARVERALRLVGLVDRGRSMPADLSGGQRKRVAIARAIVLGPELVLYDEPTTGLDPPRADLINRLIGRLRDELGVTGIVVTHDIAGAFGVADRMTMLLDGRTIFAGTPDELRGADDPRVRRFLRGEALPDELAELDGAGGPR